LRPFPGRHGFAEGLRFEQSADGAVPDIYLQGAHCRQVVDEFQWEAFELRKRSWEIEGRVQQFSLFVEGLVSPLEAVKDLAAFPGLLAGGGDRRPHLLDREFDGVDLVLKGQYFAKSTLDAGGGICE
jgi:hypothetical protein